MYDKDDKLKISPGIGPESTLFENVALTSLCRFAMFTGRGPSKILLSTEMCCSCVKFPSENGIFPDSWLFCSAKNWSIFNLPML
uniref:Uncharacterized protein n=1 Tax=Arundo donax TaxID=35708 RepID=A0A0A8Z7Y6_ARUDO